MITPTTQHLAWAEMEIGVIIHFDMGTFVPSFQWDQDWDNCPPVSAFAPDQLSTDQWMEAAVAAGAKYAVMVAKHCSGFCLWPTKYHDYHIGNTSYRAGKGDIIREFIDSCQKYGVKPGLYYSANANTYLGMNPERIRASTKEAQQAYFDIVMGQLTELWTEYGGIFEVWFDGGVIPVSDGGPDIAALLQRLQPNALVYQGPPGRNALLRWIGNERAEAPENCSAIVEYHQESLDGSEKHMYAGDTFGNLWCPAESDTPNRDAKRAFMGGWFWREGEEEYIFSGDALFNMYLTSVGRNTNLLIGMGIDAHGRFPQADTEAFIALGENVRKAFKTPLFEAPLSPDAMEYRIPVEGKASFLVLMEDIVKGERITGFKVIYEADGRKEKTVFEAKIIGHKRIIPLEGVNGGCLKVIITAAKEPPAIRRIALY